MTIVCSWIVLAAPFLSAYFLCKLIARSHSRGFFFLCLVVLWISLLIVPVQFAGVFQIAQWVTRVTVFELTWLQLSILAGVLGLFFAYRPLSDCPAEEPAIRTDEPLPSYLKLSASILGASYMLFAIDLVTSFPKGSDTLAYHIPVALRWLQNGSLRVPADKAWQFSLPGNADIIEMLGLATGRQFLISLQSWVASIVLAAAADPFAVRFSGGKKPPALAVMLVLFSIPIIEFQTFSGYVDLFGAAFLFAAVALFGHRYPSGVTPEKTTPPRNLSLTTLAVSAVACGLSLGTKTSFVPYCALFFATAVYILWREHGIYKQPFALVAGVVVLGILLPSVFWYARDLQATGNPIYPTQISLRGRVIFPGCEEAMSHAEKLLIDDPPGGSTNFGDSKFVRHRSEWWIYPWTEWLNNFGDFPVVYGEASGFGGAFAAFVIVGVGFAAYQCCRQSAFKEAASVTPTILGLWLFLLLLWLFAMRRVLRFGLPVWVLACLIAAPAIALLMKTYPRAFAVLFVSAIATTCAVSSLVPLHDLAGHIVSGKWSRSAIYDYPAFIDDLMPGSVVLNDTLLPEKDFALAGKRLTNNVVTAFEAPKELTPAFISSRNIDYVVQARSVKDTEHSSPEGLPESVPGTEVFHSTQLGRIWRIWKVEKLQERPGGI